MDKEQLQRILMKTPNKVAIDFNVLDLYMEDIIMRKGTIFSLVI